MTPPPRSADLAYEGRDLEALAFAPRYHRWILDLCRPYLGRRLAEIGAGTGNVSRLLLAEPIDCLHLVEPSRAMFERLAGIAAEAGGVELRLHNATFLAALPALGAAALDTILYINVLEHIAEDARELAAMRQILAPGGRIVVFVPALPALYGSHDRAVGHIRRYRRGELAAKVTAAGFAIRRLRWFDLAGILPWWVKYRLLRSERMEAGAVALYDGLVVPMMSRLERLIPPPIGKNLLLIAEKE